jgi:hypothetical protein
MARATASPARQAASGLIDLTIDLVVRTAAADDAPLLACPGHRRARPAGAAVGAAPEHGGRTRTPNLCAATLPLRSRKPEPATSGRWCRHKHRSVSRRHGLRKAQCPGPQSQRGTAPQRRHNPQEPTAVEKGARTARESPLVVTERSTGDERVRSETGSYHGDDLALNVRTAGDVALGVKPHTPL